MAAEPIHKSDAERGSTLRAGRSPLDREREKEDGVESSPQIADWQRYSIAARQAGRRIGFVPTMGALHAGHRSLMAAARRECDVVVVSIFVNPTQFGPQEDLAKYPRTLEADLAMCQEEGVDFVWSPAADSMYPPGYSTWVTVEPISLKWEGEHRPTHFRGVSTVVLKLFNLVRPDIAFFGQKDYQQQALIRQMTTDLDLPIEIRTCPTIRESDGLALSSRNRFLSSAERQSAVMLSRCLQFAAGQIQAGARDVATIEAEMWRMLRETPHVQPDYAALVDSRSLEHLTTVPEECVAIIAAKVGSTRLIDNWIIQTGSGG